MSKDSGLWGKFNSAVETLAFLEDGRDADYARFVKRAKDVLEESQKIYFPQSRKILSAKKIDDSVAELVKLPYLNATILTEISLPVNEYVRKTYKINQDVLESYALCIAIDVDQLKEASPNYPIASDTGIVFSFMFEVPKEARELSGGLDWILVPSVYHMAYESGRGFEFSADNVSETMYPYNMYSSKSNFGCIGLDTIINTCALLNLENTEVVEHKAPTALNKARQKRGKSELYDYKVLVVDGERWDTNLRSSSHSGHDGVRSHFRRGHIRRLETGKAVWVRSTIVQGSREGFVEKTYSLERKNAVHQVPPSVQA